MAEAVNAIALKRLTAALNMRCRKNDGSNCLQIFHAFRPNFQHTFSGRCYFFSKLHQNAVMKGCMKELWKG